MDEVVAHKTRLSRMLGRSLKKRGLIDSDVLAEPGGVVDRSSLPIVPPGRVTSSPELS